VSQSVVDDGAFVVNVYIPSSLDSYAEVGGDQWVHRKHRSDACKSSLDPFSNGFTRTNRRVEFGPRRGGRSTAESTTKGHRLVERLEGRAITPSDRSENTGH